MAIAVPLCELRRRLWDRFAGGSSGAVLEEADELVDRQTGIFQDLSHKRTPQVFVAVNRHDRLAPRVAVMPEEVMAALDADDGESSPLKRSDDFATC
jgi:hypothetical protein